MCGDDDMVRSPPFMTWVWIDRTIVFPCGCSRLWTVEGQTMNRNRTPDATKYMFFKGFFLNRLFGEQQ